MNQLKASKALLIVTGMKKWLLLSLIAILSSFPLSAQSSGFGILLGGSEGLEDGLDFDISDPVREVFYMTTFDPGTIFKLRAGQVDSDDGPRVGGGGLEREGEVQYIHALVEYRFSEVFGSTGLFAGPGFYRQEFGTLKETDYGIAAGVNALFPVTRRIGVMAEVGYHWVNFEQQFTFLTATGGVKVAF